MKMLDAIFRPTKHADQKAKEEYAEYMRRRQEFRGPSVMLSEKIEVRYDLGNGHPKRVMSLSISEATKLRDELNKALLQHQGVKV